MYARKRLALLFATLLSAAILWGCGSNGSGGSDVVVPTPETVLAVGISNCRVCHTGIAEDWLAGTGHNNPNNTPSLAAATGECTTCHDPTGDSAVLPSAFGLVARPVVGCEACHGGGSAHRGVGLIPFPTPDAARCGICHSRDDDHFGENNVTGQYFASRHAGSDKDGGSECQRCHTHEGALLFGNFTGDKTVMDTLGNTVAALPADGTNSITCATCHNPHTSGELRVSADWDPNQNLITQDQFDLCTSCHTLFTNDGTLLVASGTEASGTAAFFHNTTWFRIIATTHHDNPATGTQATSDPAGVDNPIEGYVVRKNSATPCYDCHGHEAMTNTGSGEETIHTQWASSGHGGRLLKEKRAAAAAQTNETAEQVDAVMAAAARDTTTSGGWTHYNWDRSGRGSCQRCHTATGAGNYLTALSVAGGAQPVYNAANNDFSHLSSWVASTGSPQNEMLYCWGCHTNEGDKRVANGDLRDLGDIDLGYVFPVGSTTRVVLPNIGNSTLCMTCHGGRNAPLGEGLHHAQTGGMVFNEVTHVGGEFIGQDYTNPAEFVHDTIGGTTASGPCATCHMGGGAFSNHTFEAASKDADDVIVAINNQALCNTCHTGSFAVSPAVLNEKFNGYAQTVAFLRTLPNPATDGSVTPDNGAPLTGVTSNNDQADDNANLLESHLQAAYVHNSIYTRRLLFDSINWRQNNRVLTGTVTIDLVAFPAAAAWMGADANGVVTRP